MDQLIYIYGEIGGWGDNNAQALVRQFAEIPAGAPVTLRINSMGGDIFEALAMYHILKSEKRNVIAQVDGIACSAASIVAMGATTVSMASVARMMIHLPSVSAQGDWKELAGYVILLQSIAETMAQVYARKTGKSPKEIEEKWMQPSEEKWFTAEEAVAAGLADAIIDSEYQIAASASVQAVFNSISHPKTKTMKKIISALAGLGVMLAQDASEEVLAEALKGKISALQVSEEALKQELQAYKAQSKKDAAKMLIENALSANKITASQKDAMINLAENDFENAKALLDSMIPRVSIAAQLAAQSGQNGDLSFSELHKNNPKELARIRQEEPARYAAMKAAYVQ